MLSSLLFKWILSIVHWSDGELMPIISFIFLKIIDIFCPKEWYYVSPKIICKLNFSDMTSVILDTKKYNSHLLLICNNWTIWTGPSINKSLHNKRIIDTRRYRRSLFSEFFWRNCISLIPSNRKSDWALEATASRWSCKLRHFSMTPINNNCRLLDIACWLFNGVTPRPYLLRKESVSQKSREHGYAPCLWCFENSQ